MRETQSETRGIANACVKGFLRGKGWVTQQLQLTMQNATLCGLVVGPTTFSMLIKDLAQSLSKPCNFFAEDVKAKGTNLAEDIEAVTAWPLK